MYSETICLRHCFNKKERGTCKRVRGQIGRRESRLLVFSEAMRKQAVDGQQRQMLRRGAVKHDEKSPPALAGRVSAAIWQCSFTG